MIQLFNTNNADSGNKFTKWKKKRNNNQQHENPYTQPERTGDWLTDEGMEKSKKKKKINK